MRITTWNKIFRLWWMFMELKEKDYSEVAYKPTEGKENFEQN